MLGITGDWRARELVKHIVNNDIPAGMATINSVNQRRAGPAPVQPGAGGIPRALLLVKTGSGEAVDLTAEDMRSSRSWPPGLLCPRY